MAWDVNVDEFVSNVHAVDGDSVLSPKTMDKIVRTVLDAVQMKEQHRNRVQSERRVSGGAYAEQEQED